MPKVSVIIPVYGVEKYIERCARSLFEQTLDDIEYLFIDDCTPDKSIEILKQVLEEYPIRKSQVTIHSMDKNSGQAKVREWGMKNAKGECLIHCDSDDWVDLSMYEDMYNKIKDADVVVSDIFLEGKDGRTRCPGMISENKRIISDFLLRKNNWSLWNKMFKVELFNNSSFTYPVGDMGEDMAIILQIMPTCKKIEYISTAYYHYFQNSSSICHNEEQSSKLRKYKQLKSNVDLVLENYSKLGLCAKYQQEIIALKYHVKKSLEGILTIEFVYRMWVSTFSEINRRILFCKCITLKEKIKFILITLNIRRF